MTMGEKKRVRLMLGDGPDRVELGEAEVEELPDGSFEVHVTITEPEMAKELGLGAKFAGNVPHLPWTEKGVTVTNPNTQDQQDVHEIHDLVGDINILQEETGSNTTIVND